MMSFWHYREKSGRQQSVSDIIRTMTNQELVDHYREMEHLPKPDIPDHNAEFFQNMVLEMAKRFVNIVEAAEHE